MYVSIKQVFACISTSEARRYVNVSTYFLKNPNNSPNGKNYLAVTISKEKNKNSFCPRRMGKIT